MWTVNAGEADFTAERPLAWMGLWRPMNSVPMPTSLGISTPPPGASLTADVRPLAVRGDAKGGGGDDAGSGGGAGAVRGADQGRHRSVRLHAAPGSSGGPRSAPRAERDADRLIGSERCGIDRMPLRLFEAF